MIERPVIAKSVTKRFIKDRGIVPGDASIFDQWTHRQTAEPVARKSEEQTMWIARPLCNWRWMYREGDVEQEILRAARDYHADLIVMATHGHDSLQDLFAEA